ncbi:MAG: response regulator [Anaerolineae bacterium]|nr:response regulator [Chloroflexota bacterium]MBN8634744.1 response regulator [Anaerolineae bacterium]
MTTSILIVEDESIVALDLQMRLTRLGYRVVGIAASGTEALQLAEQFQPDLTLMDIRLKGALDGIETAQALRQRLDAPIVYLTAYADEATLQRAKMTEPYGYLVKPFEERELHSTVEMALYKITNERRQKMHAARLQRLVTTVPDGVALLDPDQRIVLTNAKAQDYLITLADLSPGSVVTHLGDYTLDQLRHYDGWREIQTDTTPPRIFEVNVSCVREDDGVVDLNIPRDLVLVIRDVTADRQIRDRIQAQDRLAAVGQFAAGIAHDFNNILASIMLQPYIIQRQQNELRPRSLEALENITQQAERGAELIKQLLDFSRSSTLEMHPFDLVPLLKELAKMLERLLPASINLRLSVTEDDFKLLGDPTRTLQLLMNLASNARDAMPHGGDLYIELLRVSGKSVPNRQQSDPNDWIRIRVRDTGMGIHPEILPHIFEPFFTTKAAGKGTGLGLAQVYGIVQQHGGQIDISSQLGQGTTFSIFLPALLDDESLGMLTEAALPEPVMGEQEVILLVEDNPSIGGSLSEVLELSNYRVLSAENGHAALEKIASAQPPVNLVLSDLAMPDMGGLELCQELRRREINVPVLIFSGYVSESTLAELRALGVVDYLNKPVDVELLLERISEVLHPS